MEPYLSDLDEQQVMLEFMDIVGETADRARQFLQVFRSHALWLSFSPIFQFCGFLGTVL
jgi:hypothetical protein